MPQIIVAADRGAGFGEGTVTFRERVNVSDFESQHFATQLVERLGWAVEDADQAERVAPPSEDEAIARQADVNDGSRQADVDDGRDTGDAPTAAPPGPIAKERESRRDERVTVQSPA